MFASIRELSLGILLFSCLASLASPALAQDKAREKVQLTEQQVELNNRAVLLLKEEPPKAEEAIDLIQAALRLGPSVTPSTRSSSLISFITSGSF